MSKEIKLDLGGTAPPIHEQLGVEAERLEPMRLQEQANAIALLMSSGLITARQGDRARTLLRGRIVPIVRELGLHG